MARNVFLLACLCSVLAAGVRAQETINYASVSGRVTDQQGAVVPGAEVTARQTETNVTASRRPIRTAASGFPYPEGRTVRDHGQSAGIRRRDAHADADASARRSNCRSRSPSAGSMPA